MEKVCLFIFVACFRLTCASSFVYEESISDMLVQCNSYQSQMFDDDRTTHHCEKENFGANFSYVITEMETRYSKKSFWCFLFLKDDFYKLKFKLWLSHRDYFVDAFGVKSQQPNDDKWESRIMFKVSSFVIVPKRGFPLPAVFGFELNGDDKCPLCGKRFEPSKLFSRISGGDETNSTRWPWHVTVYDVQPESFSYKCGGTLIKSKTVITTAHCVTESGRKTSENNLQVSLGESELMSDTGHRSNIFRSIIHQGFDHYSYENDVALLMLDTQIKFSSQILPICLPHKGIVIEGSGTVVGFGGTEFDPSGSNELRSVEVPMATQEECFENDADFFGNFLNDGNFCAGEKDKLKNVCGGDAGGGFFINRNELWILKGITSNIKSDAQSSNPTCNAFAIFVDVTQYLDWIEESINAL